MSDIPVSVYPKQLLQLQIIPLGDDMPYDFKRPHRHEYFEFFFFLKGGGVHFIDFTEYRIEAQQVHLVFPGQIHLLKRKGATGLIIVCTREFMNCLHKRFYAQLFQNNYTAPCIEPGSEIFTLLWNSVSQLEKELGTNDVLAAELQRSYMSIVLTQCIRSFTPVEIPGGNNAYPLQEMNVFRQFSVLLETGCFEKMNVADYARKLAVTPKALNNCVKKMTGKTCVELIQERTLTEAKRLLLYTDMSSKEIAYELNFKDNSYFTRFFSKHTGRTPAAFRIFWEEKYHSPA